MPLAVSHLSLAGTGIRTTLAALAELHGPLPAASRRPTFATGFDVVDRALGGGVRPGELVLVGGKPGIGKTIAAMQWARSMAGAGVIAIYLSYQHDELVLLTRLLTSELGELVASTPGTSGAHSEELRARIHDVAAGAISLREALRSDPLLAEAHRRLTTCADRLVLASGSVAHTDAASITAIVERFGNHPVALFVDYVQKVPPAVDESDSAHGAVVERLKRFALERNVAVIGVAAADHAGLTAPRLHARHLRGSTALAHEPDVSIVLNDASSGVTSSEADPPAVVFSVEKNRNGAAEIDIRLEKDFAHFRFQQGGRRVDNRRAQGAVQHASTRSFGT